MGNLGMWKKYDNETYYTETGKAFTPIDMANQYPISTVEEMAIKVVGATLIDAKPLLYAREVYNIPPDATDEEAFKEMEKIDAINASESTPLERIASALEYLVMVMSEGKV